MFTLTERTERRNSLLLLVMQTRTDPGSSGSGPPTCRWKASGRDCRIWRRSSSPAGPRGSLPGGQAVTAPPWTAPGAWPGSTQNARCAETSCVKLDLFNNSLTFGIVSCVKSDLFNKSLTFGFVSCVMSDPLINSLPGPCRVLSRIRWLTHFRDRVVC